MLRSVALFVLTATADPSTATNNLFAELVRATDSSDTTELARVLETQTLSTSTISVSEDNRLSSGQMKHGVSAAEIAEKLNGCKVKQWQDLASRFREAYVLWECPTKFVGENKCYFRTYRASMLNPRFHPPNLFIHELPHRDYERCGSFLPPPPKP